MSVKLGKIKAKKSDVLRVLKENREKHEREYLEACEGYRAKVVLELNEAIKKMMAILDKISSRKGGGAVSDDDYIPYVGVKNDPPRSNLKDYDQAIKSLEFLVDDEVELDQQCVEAFLMDEWSWTETFNATKAFYSNS